MSSSNILLAYGNKAPGATLAGGSWDSTLTLNNLKTRKLAQVARSTNTSIYNTQLRADFTANYTFRALGFVNHNLTANGRWRARLTTAAMDMDFVRPNSVRPVTLTTSGGANGTRVNIYGQIEAATCPRYDFSPVNLASGAATQTLSSVPPGVYVFVCSGSGSVMATGETVANSGASCTSSLVNFVEVTATGDVTLTVTGTVTAIHFRESLGLLEEEARENLLTYSAQLDNAAWTKSALTVTANATTGPDGTASSDKLIPDATTAVHYVIQSATTSIGVVYTISLKVKAAEYSCVGLEVTAVGNFSFDTATGTVQTSGSVTVDKKMDAAGHWRVWLTFTATSTSHSYVIYPQSSLGTFSFLGDGASGIYVTGVQLEAGSLPTTYIPTTSAAVTRTADNPRISGSSFTDFYSATAGTLYVEATAAATAATRGLASLNDNSGSNVTQLFLTSVDAPHLEVYNGASQANVTTAAVTPTAVFRVAGTYAANDFAICTNGGTVGTDTSGDVPTVTQLNLGAINGSSNQLNGHIRRITYWPTRLTNAELQSITTTGPDALGIDTGWQNALQLTFHGDTPANWGEQYPLIAAFDAAAVRYGTIEIDDTTNPDAYVELGQFFAAGGFQPGGERNAEYQGFGDGRTDLSSSVKSVGGQKYSTARRRPRTVDFNFPVLEQDEGDHLDEMMAEVGTTEDVLYVPDPSDPAKTQRYGFLGTLRELTPLEYPFFDHRAMPLRLEQKL